MKNTQTNIYIYIYIYIKVRELRTRSWEGVGVANKRLRSIRLWSINAYNYLYCSLIFFAVAFCYFHCCSSSLILRHTFSISYPLPHNSSSYPRLSEHFQPVSSVRRQKVSTRDFTNTHWFCGGYIKHFIHFLLFLLLATHVS